MRRKSCRATARRPMCCWTKNFLRPSVRPEFEKLEDRTPPGFFAAANPLAIGLGLNAAGVVSPDALQSPIARSAGKDPTSWHSPIPTAEVSGFVAANEAFPRAAHEVSGIELTSPSDATANPTVVRGAPGPAPTTPSDAWAAFSSGDFFPDQFASDFPLLAHPQFGGANSSSPLSPARRGVGSDGDGTSPSSFSHEAAGSAGGGSGLYSSASDWNPLSGLVIPTGGGTVSSLSQPANVGLPANGIVPTTPVAHAPGSPQSSPPPPVSPSPAPASTPAHT